MALNTTPTMQMESVYTHHNTCSVPFTTKTRPMDNGALQCQHRIRTLIKKLALIKLSSKCPLWSCSQAASCQTMSQLAKHSTAKSTYH